MTRTIWGQERVDLQNLVEQFKDRKDLDERLDPALEGQMRKKVDAVLKAQWNPDSDRKPGAGFRRLLRRMIRYLNKAKLAEQWGVKLKTPEELEAERVAEQAERERLAAEQRQREEQERLEQLEAEKRLKKDRKLEKFVRSHSAVFAYMRSAGWIGPNGQIEADGIRAHLRYLKDKGVKSKDELIAYCEDHKDH